MIKSMTGYGKAEAEINGKKITVEIRSLNSKQLDLSVKIPAIYRQTEYEIRGDAAKKLQRGKIDLYVSYETGEESGAITINKAVFGNYLGQLRDIVKENKMDWGSNHLNAGIMPAILRLPEVVQNEAAAIPDEELATLRSVAGEAMDNLDKFRIQEGQILINDMFDRIDSIERLKNEVAPFEKPRAEAIKLRIRENIESVGIPVDTNRLEQEMIFYVEKLDITEEKVRLQNHLDYFREVARGEETAGRKLGFISQEIGREINTMGSKANDVNIQKLVVQMKDELEKIKEQLLNLL